MSRSSASTTAGPGSTGTTERSRRASLPAPSPAARWILGFPGTTLPRGLARAIGEGRVDGLMLFRDNIGGSVAGARELRREVLSLVPKGRPFVFAADEEGGLISQTSRLMLPGGDAWASVPTPRALGRVGQPAGCRFIGKMLGRRLRALGVTIDFAPSLDLDTEGENPVIGSRSFGADPVRVAELGLSLAEGLALAGVAPCFKHYPGHGGTRLDSHRTLPTMDPRERGRHESPFKDCLRAIHAGSAVWERRPRPWVMGAHVDWGDGVPASLHPTLLARVRRWLPGTLLVTDSLEMGAVSLAAGAARQASDAGNDLLLVARGWEAALAGMEASSTAGASVVSGAPGAAGSGSGRGSRGGRAARVLEELVQRTDRRVSLSLPREDEAYLARLHLASVRLSCAPAELPEGPWTWVVPEGLSPYARLRDWTPPSDKASSDTPTGGRRRSDSPSNGRSARDRRRFCAEVVWIPETASAAFIASIARRLAGGASPVLVGTLFRGRPGEAIRAAWRPLVEHPRVRVLAHLLDEGWPEPTGPGGTAVAFTSGPSVESLAALARALEMPDEAWRRGDDGLHLVVDRGPAGLAK
jgi:beta-N-acetylhexosaminidase